MIIDMNAYLGRWGIRTKGIATVREFLDIMDKNKIDISVVTGTIALITDTFEGNLYLVNLIKNCSKRLIPIVCINPIWGMDEVKKYFDIYDFKIVRLSPNLHNYSLNNKKLIEPFIKLFEEKKVILYITCEICHQFSSLSNKIGYSIPKDYISEIVKFTENFPSQKIVICGYEGELLQEVEFITIPSLKKYSNLFLEISNIFAFDILEKFAKRVPEKILLGTGNGILYPSGSISKVLYARINEELKEKILYQNAEKLLKELNII